MLVFIPDPTIKKIITSYISKINKRSMSTVSYNISNYDRAPLHSPNQRILYCSFTSSNDFFRNRYHKSGNLYSLPSLTNNCMLNLKR